MALIDRAAQFSPFAALTGHEGAIRETARVTDARAELDEDVKAALSDKLQIITARIEEHPEVLITYFKPDSKKKGGSYITVLNAVRKIDEHEKMVFLIDGTSIPIDEITGIQGQIFIDA